MPEPALRGAQSIPGSDGVRVLAALAVLAYHLPGRDRLLLAVVLRVLTCSRTLAEAFPDHGCVAGRPHRPKLRQVSVFDPRSGASVL